MSDIYLDLLSCQRVLASRIGESAPAYVTLRRWASDGKLKRYEHTKSGEAGHRVTYDVEQIERLVLNRPIQALGSRKVAKSATQPRVAAESVIAAVEAGELISRLDLVFDTFQIFVARQAAVEDLLKECVQGIARLDAVRTSLMLKYDSQSAHQAETIEQLKARVKSLERSGDGDRFSLKIAMEINRLSEQVGELLRKN